MKVFMVGGTGLLGSEAAHELMAAAMRRQRSHCRRCRKGRRFLRR